MPRKPDKSRKVEVGKAEGWWWPHDPIVRFTALLALFTLLLVIVAVLQWRAFEKADHSMKVAQRPFNCR
jgi:hypothetical protein